MARTRRTTGNGNSSANIGFEAKLWLAAGKLHRNMDAAEYKHTVLGLVAGFCFSATTTQIASLGYALTPGRYVRVKEVEDNGEPFEEKMPRLVAELEAQFAESVKLEKTIRQNLKLLRA